MLRFLAINNEGDLTTDYQSKWLGVFTENCSGANMYFTIGSHPVSQARPSLPSLIDWDLKVVFPPVGVWFSHRVVLEIEECYFWFCEKVKLKIDLSWTFLWFSSRSISCAASTWSLLVKIQIFLVAKRWKCRDHDIYFNIIRISYIDVEFGKILCALGKYCVKMLFKNPETVIHSAL